MNTPKRFLAILSPFLLILIIAASIPGGAPTAASPDGTDQLPSGTFVARVYYNDLRDIEQLVDYDVFEFNNLAERYVLVGLDALTFAELADAGWHIVVDDATTAVMRPEASQQPFFNGYRTVDDLYTDLEAIAAEHPNIATLVEYGASYCELSGGCETLGGHAQPGYPLRAMRVTNTAVVGASQLVNGELIRGEKPVFFLLANIHAREITTPEIAMRMLDWLVDGYGTNPDATWLVDWHEIWIVPTANPDGHWLVELGDSIATSPYYQRKNANNDADNDTQPDCSSWPPDSGWQYGVDLNRNHSFEFGGSGSSGTPCRLTYRGPSPASEPEVAALQTLVETLIPDQRGPELDDAAPLTTRGLLITMHSYSELVLYPWGHTADLAPNSAGMGAIAEKLASYNGYRPCQSARCLYSADGTTDDWAYGELGIPAYTFEIGTQFMPAYSIIDAKQWPLNAPALQTAAKLARQPYTQIQGPDVTSVEVAAEGESSVRVTAVLDTTSMQTSTVTGATLTVDVPFWAGGTEIALEPVDGAFDEAVEAGTAVVDLSPFGPDQHLILVQGTGTDEHVGPTTAVFATQTGQPSSTRTLLPFITR